MPLVTVNLLKGRSAEEKDSIAASIQTALVSTLEVPDANRYQLFNEYDGESFRHNALGQPFSVRRISGFKHGRGSLARIAAPGEPLLRLRSLCALDTRVRGIGRITGPGHATPRRRDRFYGRSRIGR
jgi:phenylpyruvate tautomerase PptA (4-oxalocrotonate tautomerase family)